MKRTLFILATILCLSYSAAGYAYDATLEVSENTLNGIIDKIGVLSDSGVAQPWSVSAGPRIRICHPIGYLDCPELQRADLGLGKNRIPLVVCEKVGGEVVVLPNGEPVPWQWWISRTKITVDTGEMKFTATVTTNVDGSWKTTTKTVGASVHFDGGSNKMMVDIDEFKVPLTMEDGRTLLGVEPVDVAKYFNIAVPIVPQQFSVPLINGSTRNVTGRVVSATAEYLPCKLKVNFNVGF